ncbi:unnamed protein product [Rotaria sordida]|uniref:Rap-GAP domain-containing protein n=2 Tax=Rotaria sordida TaxID=392033 RepID=A0A819CSX6_9BILA|nr:unnamed protein product [Rotaria sordida]
MHKSSLTKEGNEKIVEFDKYNDNQLLNKIGFICQNSNQSNELEMLSKNEMSIEIENFLNIICEPIELKDLNKYDAHLDRKTNQDKIYSYFTIFKNHKIMFYVGSMISSDKNDQESIQRINFISNTLLCIVFQQGNQISFQPDFFIENLTQVYITVQPIYINSQLYYKIEIWRRSDIEPLVDPPGGIFKHDKSFRNYFLTLILNTMNIILKKDFFYKHIVEQRYRLKNEYIIKLYQIFYSYSIFDLSILSNNNYNNDRQFKNLNKTRQTTSKYLQFMGKFIETFTNNRSKSISHR